MIDTHLGPRGQAGRFSYSDIIANQMSVFLAGGDCAEDLTEHLRSPLSYSRALAVCIPDTLLRGIKELRCDSEPLVHPTSGGAYKWRAIMTNDTTKPPKQIIAFYNSVGPANASSM